ncbi:amino acid ABC transporter substrate-binding protein [Tropicimonas sp. TH_r6]|uniref:amino acid ABC transporter substrate-binding protein n=1 Tax=Tropicimonas sp. TH_r6 TaxID=3082085 RepID=UPI0029549297|nr:amino acid ABC transporter substrate-binding protein [Tropicimonas sp. TH_r6]MDV7144702.1 amino acid ABC transporter substrate-binding protein [Tropicimonas sp. TH_r6]
MRVLTLFLTLALGVASQTSAQTIERIRETGELKLGYRTDAAPISYANEEGNAAGYSALLCVGVAQAVANSLDMEDLAVSFHQVSALDRFDKIASGEIDLLCGASTITLERRNIVDFSIPTFVDGAVVLLPRNGKPAFAALDGKRIGVRVGTTTQKALEASIKKAGITAEQVPFESHDEGVDALSAGEIDAYFGDQSILAYQMMTKDLGSDLRITDQLLSIEKQGLAMTRGDTDFRLLIDAILSTLYRNGAMQRIYQETLVGKPGQAIRALHMIAPEMP